MWRRFLKEKKKHKINEKNIFGLIKLKVVNYWNCVWIRDSNQKFQEISRFINWALDSLRSTSLDPQDEALIWRCWMAFNECTFFSWFKLLKFWHFDIFLFIQFGTKIVEILQKSINLMMLHTWRVWNIPIQVDGDKSLE